MSITLKPVTLTVSGAPPTPVVLTVTSEGVQPVVLTVLGGPWAADVPLIVNGSPFPPAFLYVEAGYTPDAPGQVSGSAVMIGAGTLIANGRVIGFVSASASLVGIGTLYASGELRGRVFGSATLLGAGSLSANGTVILNFTSWGETNVTFADLTKPYSELT